MCELTQYRQHGLIDELGKATRFGGLPDAVLYGLINLAADFDMSADEKLRAGMSLRAQRITDLPGGVAQQVRGACEDVRRARSEDRI